MKAVPFFIKSIAAENLSNAVFVHSTEKHEVELLLDRKPAIDVLYFKNDKMNVAVKMEKKVNHLNVLSFVETCLSKSKIRSEGGSAELGLHLTWNFKDIELRAKFYDGWFQKSHHYKYLKDEMKPIESSIVTVMRGSEKILSKAIDKVDFEEIFSHTFKEDL